MGFWNFVGPVLSGIGSVLGASKSSSGSKTPPSVASDAPIDAPVEAPQGGSKFTDLFKENLKDAFATGVQSVVGTGFSRASDKIFGMPGEYAGKNNRAYLDASFPELNPWEKAGAQATQAGTQMGHQKVQEKMQARELSTRMHMQTQDINLAKEQIAAGILMNKVSSQAQTASAAISASPHEKAVDALNYLRNSQGDLANAQEHQSWLKSIRNVLMRPTMYPADKETLPKSLAAIAAETGLKGIGNTLGKTRDIFLDKKGEGIGSLVK